MGREIHRVDEEIISFIGWIGRGGNGRVGTIALRRLLSTPRKATHDNLSSATIGWIPIFQVAVVYPTRPVGGISVMFDSATYGSTGRNDEGVGKVRDSDIGVRKRRSNLSSSAMVNSVLRSLPPRMDTLFLAPTRRTPDPAY